MKAQKVRLDDLLIKKGIAESKSLAQSLIIAGRIYLGEKKLDKPGHTISDEANIIFRGPLHPWVSRGGIKLAHALKIFNLSVRGLTALDIGASTGGFADVLLQNGVEKIYAVDVGYGQLHEKLLNNSKVVSMERKNARYLNTKDVPQLIDILVCDASFISLRKILPEPIKLCAKNAKLIALIKPQFEVGKKNISKGGVVKDEELRNKCCEEIRLWFEITMKWNVHSIIESPIRGAKGNIEYLIYANK
jgi:23S rRNA (cytidine1920-2'-O)/16S rRNA (cytidine1409-2'-O)-methyltransferase